MTKETLKKRIENLGFTNTAENFEHYTVNIQTWLRDMYGIYILVECDTARAHILKTDQIWHCKVSRCLSMTGDDTDYYKSYYKALYAGIRVVLQSSWYKQLIVNGATVFKMRK